MKIRRLLAAAGLAAFAASAFAQTAGTTGNAQQDMNAQKADPMMMQQSAPPAWSRIKGHEKGFVAKSDVQPNTWLAANFKACDKNANDKVTQDEYSKCRQAHQH